MHLRICKYKPEGCLPAVRKQEARNQSKPQHLCDLNSIMAPSAIDCDKNTGDLNFLTEIKNEVSIAEVNGLNFEHASSSPTSVYLGMRRNSSFADYFEGDLSQNLLSRRHFLYSDGSSSNEQKVISTLVDEIKCEANKCSRGSTAEVEGKLRKLSSALMGHWFFTNGGKEGSSRRRRTISLPSDCINIDDEENGTEVKDESNNILTRMVAKHFSATTDVRAFNINMPQSQ